MDQRGRNHVSAEDRRHAPEFAEALGLLAAGSLVEGYGDSMSRSEVFGGFTFAQWLTILTGERPTSSTGINADSCGRDAHKACRNGGTTRRSEGLSLEVVALGTAAIPEYVSTALSPVSTNGKGEPKEGTESQPNHGDS